MHFDLFQAGVPGTNPSIVSIGYYFRGLCQAYDVQSGKQFAVLLINYKESNHSVYLILLLGCEQWLTFPALGRDDVV